MNGLPLIPLCVNRRNPFKGWLKLHYAEEAKNLCIRMSNSQAIVDFQISCQKYFICYTFAESGLSGFANKLASDSPDRDSRLFVGSGHPNIGHTHAMIGIGEAIDSSQTNGAFSDKIAKSFITAIYSEWDEIYRQKLALESRTDAKLLKCDLMGDIRLVRHCIVHKKSKVTDEHTKIKELKWSLSPGILVVTKEMFSMLIDQINQMLVRVDLEL